ncbi:MAG TPA: UvrD-helicase domain-containing protein [Candidatus Paceibacterota bacterium]|nr:UvrD-helicase domain-containing protein [Candidatus Paceibacterota bacterium]
MENLNERQKEAVLTTSGPLLILAGAGAGKTKTITHRILHLIKEGVSPHSILAITFTNKAAKEMRERVFDLLKSDEELNRPISFFERPFVSTFHALGVHIIKENSRLLDLPRHFSIFDRADSKRAVKESLEILNLDPKKFEPAKILHVISREKGNNINQTEYAESVGREYFGRIAASVWQEYEKILKRERALDFDDLLLKTVDLLKNNREILEKYQKIWRYIHIDEYQDTNRVQYMIAKLLAEKEKNICVVGDIDQNIYSWRGADIRNILNFEKDYPEAKIILLEENYRSSEIILQAANKIIQKNVHRKEKNLFTRKKGGAKIGLYSAYDEIDEADFISRKSAELIEGGVAPEEIAVLYRANFQSRVLEEMFLMREIPYQILGVRFFERKEVKDVLSYLRAALNPDSLSDIKRIINVPARGLGKVTLLAIASNREEALSPAIKKKIAEFRNLLSRIQIQALKEKPSNTIKYIIKESGMEEMYKKGKEEDEERLENMKELVTLATRYDALAPQEGIEELLADAALATDQDEMEERGRSVKLMTVHASKGLEFSYVFISGLESELFPHLRLSEEELSEENQEEERRLFYVALTRAKEKLYLSYASVRTIYGSKRISIPSEFIIDLDEELLEPEENLSEKTIHYD